MYEARQDAGNTHVYHTTVFYLRFVSYIRLSDLNLSGHCLLDEFQAAPQKEQKSSMVLLKRFSRNSNR